jgi:enoyl-[acyl-carrier protein] reductase I
MTNNILKGKRGIISGALDKNSIGWRIAIKAMEEGATFTLTNAAMALRLGDIRELSNITGAKIIQANATVVEEVENVYSQSMDELGGKIDFVLHSIGMSVNVRKGKSYGDLNYEWYQKGIDISALSLHKFLQVAEKMDALNEWGSVVALSYIAAQRAFPFYGDMSDSKAMLESIARNYGYRYGRLKKVRVNTVSQSPTRTLAASGIEGFDTFYEFANKMSPLGNASADDCANFVVTLFSDYTRMITMQNLYHDGGYSSTGISEDLADFIK